MITPRKITLPVDESCTLTDELPFAECYIVQSQDEFFAGAAKRVREFREGNRAPTVTSVSFESVEAMLEAMLEATKNGAR